MDGEDLPPSEESVLTAWEPVHSAGLITSAHGVKAGGMLDGRVGDKRAVDLCSLYTNELSI